jgi:dihydroorotate dehydrogenase
MNFKLLHKLDAETAHDMAIWALHNKLVPNLNEDDLPVLATEVFGLKFKNPIGMAAGFDKNARAVDGLFKLGFAAVEVGTVTPKPQYGNPKPRLFRLSQDEAIINRLGFNNKGVEVFLKNISKAKRQGVLGINIGPNKDSTNFYNDYLVLIEKAAPIADYITVNVSSPNTPGLRDLQKKEAMQQLLKDVVDIRNSQKHKPPLLVKIAPDLTDEEIDNITDIALTVGIDGIIATNTTISRPALASSNAKETGGLSGKPVRDMSTEVIRKIYTRSLGKVTLVGVGGVFSAEDAFAKIAAGASLVQVYTGLIYKGPTIVRDIKQGLVKILADKKIASVKDAVGIAN